MENSIITYKDYGNIVFDLKSVMDERNITVSQVVRRTGLHHKVVRRYYDGTVERYDKDVLAKLCFVINCDLSDIMFYKK